MAIAKIIFIDEGENVRIELENVLADRITPAQKIAWDLFGVFKKIKGLDISQFQESIDKINGEANDNKMLLGGSTNQRSSTE